VADYFNRERARDEAASSSDYRDREDRNATLGLL
jgi:hypothetical protein